MSEAHDHQSPAGDTWGQQGQGRLQAFAVVAGFRGCGRHSDS